MKDTSPEIEQLVRERIMARSGSERFVMGALMFDAARKMIIASLPKDISTEELRARLFERIYGCKLEEFVGR